MHKKNDVEQSAQRISWIGIVCVFVGLVILNPNIIQQRSDLELEKSTYYDTPKKVLGGAFREIRVTLADILWIKVDTYFHAGLSPEEHEALHPGHKEHMEGIEHEDKDVANTQFLPLIRLVTDLDPNFIDAYRSGSWWLWKRLNQTQSAIDFLKEGIENNPDKFELHYDLAWIYFLKLENYPFAGDELITAATMKMDERDRSSVLELLGYTYERLDKNDNALQIWKIVEKLNVLPYSTTAKRKIVELMKSD